MEFLNRLRTVWTALCIVAAFIFFVGYTGNPQPNIMALAVASAIGAFCFHITGSWRAKLSLLWLGGVGVALAGSQIGRGDKLVLQAVLFVAGAWIVAAVAVYLIGGLIPKSSRISGTD